MVVNQAGEDVAAGAVDDLPDLSRVNMAMFGQGHDPAVGDQNIRLSVEILGRVNHMAAFQPKVVFFRRFNDFHARYSSHGSYMTWNTWRRPRGAFSACFLPYYPNNWTGSILICGIKPTMISARTRPAMNGIAALDILSMLIPDMDAPTNRL